MTEPQTGFFRAIAHWARHRFWRPLLAVPVIVALSVYMLSRWGVFGWDDTRRFKALMEIVHPAFLSVMAVMSWGWWVAHRKAAYAFLGVLSLFVLSREVLGQGSTYILAVGTIGLSMYGNRNREMIAPFLQNRLATSLLGACIVCYTFSQLLDRSWLAGIVRIAVSDPEWNFPFTSNMEEALESAGGALLMLTPAAVRRADSPRQETASA